MPRLESRDIGIAFDMHGCPNACRHCYLGRSHGPHLTERDVRWGCEQFRGYRRDGQTAPFFETLKVYTWFREPDYSDDYRRLHALSAELSDGEPMRFELLSVWRLARDPDYAAWAHQVSPDTCQISLFGLEDTNDWFYRRKGAFEDCLAATKRLLEVGMKPRWQLFLTRKILPELDGLMRLVDELRLPERVEALGDAFDLFLHPPGPDGEGRNIEHLRPTLEELGGVPEDLIASTKRHGKRDVLWRPERDWHAEILREQDPKPYSFVLPEGLTFYVKGDFDVYANIGPLEPPWRLGNLKSDGVATIIDAYEDNRPLAMRAMHTVAPSELARRFGDPQSTRVYETADDLRLLYLYRYCDRLSA